MKPLCIWGLCGDTIRCGIPADEARSIALFNRKDTEYTKDRDAVD